LIIIPSFFEYLPAVGSENSKGNFFNRQKNESLPANPSH
jgi:hypothetical protein